MSPFGSKNWVEGYGAAERSLAFTLQQPSGMRVGDVKRIDSLGPEGLVLQANVDGKDHAPGVVIAIVQ